MSIETDSPALMTAMVRAVAVRGDLLALTVMNWAGQTAQEPRGDSTILALERSLIYPASVIVWIASYPRSGNTFLRILLHRLYGVPTYVIYDVDGVAERIGTKPIGFRERPMPLGQMRSAPEPYFIKTHRQRMEPVDAGDKAICLCRDGRDSIVSWARLNTEDFLGAGDYEARFHKELSGLITRRSGGTGGWGQNVLSWFGPSAPSAGRVQLRYEELIKEPRDSVLRTVAKAAPDLQSVGGASVPTFGDLQQLDSGFFRRGAAGSYRAELPDELHDLFWIQPDNAAAMALLDYRHGFAPASGN